MADKPNYTVPESEYTIIATRSSGPGGQHVNKTSTAIILKFDIPASSLPDKVKQRLMSMKDNRITDIGVIVIRADTERSQKRNREEAVARLHEIVHKAMKVRKKRVPTKPTKTAIETRLQEKARRSETKSLRRKPV